jgi:SAM-dependent methyltransferase
MPKPTVENLYSANREFWNTHVRPRPGRTLIVGSRVYKGREDRRAAFADAVGVDMLDGPGVDIVGNLEETVPHDRHDYFDHIECRSVLEHSPRPWLLAANLERMLVPGGTLDLSVPFVWGLHSYPSDLFRYSAEGVRALFPGIEWRALQYAGATLYDGGKTPRAVVDGHIYIARTECLGFGIKA